MEDSKFFRSVLQRAVEVRTELTAVVASSMAEARQIVDREHEGFLLSLLDLNLPDAPQGEIVDYIQSRQIPAIVFTGKFDESVRESILAKDVIDYVVKVNQNSLDQVVGLISRFQKNRSVKVLVVEDSRSANEYVTRLLQTYGYIVLSAFDGENALAIMKKNPEIAIVITDYNMPGMDGFELVSRLRESHSKDELAIIGLSGGGNPIISAKFLKIGANDFLNKPFLREEFYCRVNQSIEIIEIFQSLKESAMRDFLTGLYNRRFLMQSGTKILEHAKRQGHQVCAALMDLDYFKSINDTYGHDAGDLVIRNTAKRLSRRFRSEDIVARYGGEEFAVVMTVQDAAVARSILDDVRRDIAGALVPYDGVNLSCTMSIGAAIGQPNTLEDLVSQADTLLYKAKETGRDRVVAEPCRV